MIRTTLRMTALGAGTLLALATLASPPSQAQTPATGAAVAFTNARIIDGTGRPPIERGTLVIGGGRVIAVGPAASTAVPAGAQRIDANGKTIVPGFINDHAHLNVDRDFTGNVREDLIRRLKMYANYGVTSTVSLGSGQADEADGFKLMQEQDHAGLDRARL
jgi:imidazolonepropionase-like amidohydrolase